MSEDNSTSTSTTLDVQESESDTTYMHTKTVTSSLCIIPPDYMHEYIDKFRKIHDAAYSRWPPHINLVFPFIPVADFPSVKTKLEEAFKINNVSCFVIRLDTISYFKQSDKITVHAKPKYTQELYKIYDIICSTLNIEKTRDFAPHMTLGQFDKNNTNIVNELKVSWGSGLCVPVYSLTLAARPTNNQGPDRFVAVDVVNL